MTLFNYKRVPFSVGDYSVVVCVRLRRHRATYVCGCQSSVVELVDIVNCACLNLFLTYAGRLLCLLGPATASWRRSIVVRTLSRPANFLYPAPDC